MKTSAFIPNFLRFYNILWRATLPFLRKNPRLAPSFSRRLHFDHLDPADVWIQAASAGEAFLALSIVNTLTPDQPIKVLLTTTTDQGMQILEQGLTTAHCHSNVRPVLDWFPFDMPDTINSVVLRVRPKVMVLLETELWPALLWALKTTKTRVLVVNARMSAKSLRNYRLSRGLWKALAPDRIFATSSRDARRYSRIFSPAPVETMNNIKFDIMEPEETDIKPSSLAPLLPDNLPLSILASVRRQEETEMIKIISRLKQKFPDQIIALFPRHMHRIGPIQKQLTKNRIDIVLGSQLTAPLKGPGIVLWDRFGELRAAYAHAATVFVGGSLGPLGGQNFIEPAVLGVPTVTGPHWDDFAWVGKGIFEQKIVTQCRDWQEVTRTMLNHLGSSQKTTHKKQKARDYIKIRQGGSQTACRSILTALNKSQG